MELFPNLALDPAADPAATRELSAPEPSDGLELNRGLVPGLAESLAQGRGSLAWESLEKYDGRMAASIAEVRPKDFLVHARRALRDLEKSMDHDGLSRIGTMPLNPYTEFKFSYYLTELDIFQGELAGRMAVMNQSYTRNRGFASFENAMDRLKARILRLKGRVKLQAAGELDSMQKASLALEADRGLGMIAPAAALAKRYEKIIRAAEADRGSEHLAVLKRHFQDSAWPPLVPSPQSLARYWNRNSEGLRGRLQRDFWAFFGGTLASAATTVGLNFFGGNYELELLFCALAVAACLAVFRVAWLGFSSDRVSAKLRDILKV